ncbi:MAG: hypothetical protein RL757_2475 [Bacteroidota bacterium]|jgi:ADP-L-glycero-D-manno-heptose 6-epimerase
MIIVTGAYGFIGSYLIGALQAAGLTNIVAVDDWKNADKKPNLANKKNIQRVHRRLLFGFLEKNATNIDFIFHLGARTDTTEFDYSVLKKLNLDYSKKLWKACAAHQIPLIFASSAATYGAGEHGYDDFPTQLSKKLEPLNPYGKSKNEFDKWIFAPRQQQNAPPAWFGFKFFNVYGPNEYHKKRMASTIFHFFNQIETTGKARLFESHRPDFGHGEQMRDFVYVKDVAAVLMHFQAQKDAIPSGIYNLGTGKARTFNDLVRAVFAATGKTADIEYTPTPVDIRDKYQYFTEANMLRVREQAHYTAPFHSLEAGIEDYVKNFLINFKTF